MFHWFCNGKVTFYINTNVYIIMIDWLQITILNKYTNKDICDSMWNIIIFYVKVKSIIIA